jgi:hypothetical protein
MPGSLSSQHTRLQMTLTAQTMSSTMTIFTCIFACSYMYMGIMCIVSSLIALSS